PVRRQAVYWLGLVTGGAVAIFSPARGPAQTQEVLVCGVPQTRHLEAGQSDTYQIPVSGDYHLAVDVADTSGTIGLLRLRALNYLPNLETCNGSLAFKASALEVSDCLDNDVGDYAIEVNVVSEGPQNCGTALSCGVAPDNTALNVPGEVDAYTF